MPNQVNIPFTTRTGITVICMSSRVRLIIIIATLFIHNSFTCLINCLFNFVVVVVGSVDFMRSWKSAPLGRHDTGTAAVSRSAQSGASATGLLQLSEICASAFHASVFLAPFPVFTMFFVMPRKPFGLRRWPRSSWEGLNRPALSLIRYKDVGRPVGPFIETVMPIAFKHCAMFLSTNNTRIERYKSTTFLQNLK